ncbi:MAG: coproporphyrinogen III oxidase [Ignavibacteriae bacterium HGW-Ignavibacteriae-2]|nr:MAG: coproporphyrinogen III oxidase [Ignavibacteriae bacterium HGW-Ignavibacteriae-2]
MNSLSVYIHIPFCDHKCIYCDFYSIIRYDNTSEFFNSLHKEIDHYAQSLSSTHKIKTIFFGGGTPSFVNPTQINSIIEKLKSNFIFEEKVEITLETNPGTVSSKKINEFISTGINRFSVGIQSFNDEELNFLTRIHDKKTAISTVENIAAAGIENINVDLIFNLPGQSKEKWESNLLQAANLPVKHISAYSLILEKGTILNKMVMDGNVEMQDENYDADLYEHTIDFMELSGFNQYEVSNFCKPGYECVHNLAYWEHKEYLGLGTSSHSFIGKERWWNYSSLKMYIDSVNSKRHAVRSIEQLTELQLLEEFIMLNLRGRGLNLIELEKKFGTNWQNNNSNYLKTLVSEGFITYNNNFIKFTKQGYTLCDEILIKFI